MIRSRRGEAFPIFDDQDLLFFILAIPVSAGPRRIVVPRPPHPSFLRGRVVRRASNHPGVVVPFTAERVWPHVMVANRALHPMLMVGSVWRNRLVAGPVFAPPTICKSARHTPTISKVARHTPTVSLSARHTPTISKKGQFDEC